VLLARMTDAALLAGATVARCSLGRRRRAAHRDDDAVLHRLPAPAGRPSSHQLKDPIALHFPVKGPDCFIFYV
jgi:hypothetical protein